MIRRLAQHPVRRPGSTQARSRHAAKGRLAPTVLLALCCAATGAALAGDMYKWQDENGIWHFSDKPPKENREYATFEVPVSSGRERVFMRRAGTEREPEHVIVNQFRGPVEVELQLAEARNVVTDPPLPATLVINGGSERTVLRAGPADPRAGFTYRLSWRWVPGPPQDDLPENLDFPPPFPAGQSFPVSQGFDGDHTHTDEQNGYAIDIVMPEGTPVLSVRDGVVMEIEDDFHDGGTDKARYVNRANVIRVLHDDGTMAVYAHLQPRTAQVRSGSRVRRGQWLANSGNTGFSSGPHLHFAIQINAGMTLQSLPFRFQRPEGGTMMPFGVSRIAGVLPQP